MRKAEMQQDKADSWRLNEIGKIYRLNVPTKEKRQKYTKISVNTSNTYNCLLHSVLSFFWQLLMQADGL